MANDLRDRRIAILATDGVALVLPGGTINPDNLRADCDVPAFCDTIVRALSAVRT